MHPPDGPPGALSPKDWRALVDYDKWHDTYTPNDGVALHHGGGTDYASGRAPFSVPKEIQQLQQWEGHHIHGRGWRGLAYGWAVGQTGTIFRARGWHIYGAHTGDLDGDGIANNKEIVPIIFLGSGHHHNLSPAAQNAISSLRRWIEVHSPKAKRLYGHQELKGTVTSCPGPKLMTYVRSNRLLPEDDMPLNAADLAAIKATLVDVLGGGRITMPKAGDTFDRFGNQGVVNSVWHATGGSDKLANVLTQTRTFAQKAAGAVALDPVQIADAIIADIGTDLAGKVVDEMSARLSL